jgi:hypothetical protein
LITTRRCVSFGVNFKNIEQFKLKIRQGLPEIISFSCGTVGNTTSGWISWLDVVKHITATIYENKSKY